MNNWERFVTDYPPALAQAMRDHPNDYMQGLSAELIAAKMLARIKSGTIGAVNIQSHSFKALAKKYGIKNTYKDWNRHLFVASSKAEG